MSLLSGCVHHGIRLTACFAWVLPSIGGENEDINHVRLHDPYDFMSIYDDPGAKIPAPLTARAQILHDIIGFFGLTGPPGHSPVPNATKFTARAYPNPFNPMTKIELTMPRTAEVTVKIYNIRGELVQVLVDEVRTAGVSSVIWDGTNNSRASVASGVYFYEARMGHEVQVHKIALVK